MYTVKTTKVPTKPGYWDHTQVEIFKDDTKIGEYTRNYSAFYNTFFPFTQNGKDYALISEHYTGTSVIELPSCKIIAEEPKAAFGFCPTDFYVPKEIPDRGLKGQFGFVAGCIWGDDTSWKIQYLDLSQIENGIIKRDDRFGYIELSDNYLLEQSIDVTDYYVKDEDDEPFIKILCQKEFKLDNKSEIN